MICCSVGVWWKDEDSPGHEYTRYLAFETEQDYKSYNLSPADFGVPNSASWQLDERRIDFSDLPGWVQEWVETHDIPNGVIPDRVGETLCETRQLLARTSLPEDRKEYYRQELDFLQAWSERLKDGGAR